VPTGARDRFYRALNPVLFASQLALSVACLWSRSSFLLEFHDSIAVRSLGAALLASSLLITRLALRHLAENYAPCYDAHLPRALVVTGPYAWIRHPMYLAKLLAGIGTVLFSGSLWLLPSAVYLFIVTLRAVRTEERELSAHLPGYEAYCRDTRCLVPGLF